MPSMSIEGNEQTFAIASLGESLPTHKLINCALFKDVTWL